MYQSGHFFGLISAFNPYLTEQVTIIKDGTSAEYGDGVSGIISMQSKNTIEGNFFGGAGFNMISADLHGQVPISDKLAFQFSARRSITDLINTPTYNQFVKLTLSVWTTVFFKYSHKNSASTWTASAKRATRNGIQLSHKRSCFICSPDYYLNI